MLRSDGDVDLRYGVGNFGRWESRIGIFGVCVGSWGSDWEEVGEWVGVNRGRLGEMDGIFAVERRRRLIWNLVH